ncbi:TrmH family RNA methyltransferase [Roseofilum casamattae]|uniref:TrmH family RNA methyltransferase n=1 Tax=Roseofilum casamattae BLCC-M143 TaxID=3022442 RepID=A0ABT7BYK3_9CYAN|nr:TrmH family RNA methyltransferase [Roseofilum casamattae]MDJ1183531.1 TrmH family RNA methyltransferase [Roseofilum casamattae BLCC-M143]
MERTAQKTNRKWPFKEARPGEVPAVIMFDPRDPFNVGSAVRAASCFGVSQVWVTGERCAQNIWTRNRIPREERMKGFSDVNIILDDRPLEHFTDVTPVAVELLPNSENLLVFEHPENAIYLFGPEDGSVPNSIRRLCHRRVFIPTRHCTNLGAAIYLLLYDRLMKRYLSGAETALPIGEVLAEPRGWPVHNPVFESR